MSKWIQQKKNVKKNIAHNLNIIFNVFKTIDQIMVIYFEINAKKRKKKKLINFSVIEKSIDMFENNPIFFYLFSKWQFVSCTNVKVMI